MKSTHAVLCLLLLLVTITLPATAKLKGALYADTNYPTKKISEINVIGTLDLRAETSCKIDLNEDVTARFRQILSQAKSYKVKNWGGVMNALTSTYGLKKKKKFDTAIEDSLLRTLKESDLDSNRVAWLTGLPPAVGNWVSVLVLHEATANGAGGGVRIKSDIEAYLFDRTAKSLIWRDRVILDERVSDWSRTSADQKSLSYNPADRERACIQGVQSALWGRMRKTIPKQGKTFAPPRAATAVADSTADDKEDEDD
jgi:hypothetical protein